MLRSTKLGGIEHVVAPMLFRLNMRGGAVVARLPHKQEVAGSIPVPATKHVTGVRFPDSWFAHVRGGALVYEKHPILSWASSMAEP